MFLRLDPRSSPSFFRLDPHTSLLTPAMSYRGFKRLLGETSLERKCRWLLGEPGCWS